MRFGAEDNWITGLFPKSSTVSYGQPPQLASLNQLKLIIEIFRMGILAGPTLHNPQPVKTDIRLLRNAAAT